MGNIKSFSSRPSVGGSTASDAAVGVRVADVLRIVQKKRLYFLAEKKPLKYKRVHAPEEVGPRTFYVTPSDADHTEAVSSETRLRGVTETRDAVYPGNIIMGGPEGERYVIRTPKFFDLYNTVDNVATVRNDNPRKAVRVTRELLTMAGIKEDGFEFTAPWGETMIAAVGDVLIIQGRDEMYRVEKNAFDATYRVLMNKTTPTKK